MATRLSLLLGQELVVSTVDGDSIKIRAELDGLRVVSTEGRVAGASTNSSSSAGGERSR